MEDNDLKDAKALTAKGNIQIMRKLVKDWNLGPDVANDNQQGNGKFWKGLADIMYVKIEEARRMSCASCEYGHISPEYLAAMEHVPYNKFDKDGGIRVWCDKFDFICHATRVCKMWNNESEEE